MKILFLVFCCVATSILFAQENYLVQLGDSSYSVSLDSNYHITLQGKKLNLSLRQKQILAYNDSLFSFSYLPDFKITKTSY